MMFSSFWKKSWNHEIGQTRTRDCSCKLYVANSCNEGKCSALIQQQHSLLCLTLLFHFSFSRSRPVLKEGNFPVPVRSLPDLDYQHLRTGVALANMDVTKTPPAAPDARHPIEEIISLISCSWLPLLPYLRLTDRFWTVCPKLGVLQDFSRIGSLAFVFC